MKQKADSLERSLLERLSKKKEKITQISKIRNITTDPANIIKIIK